MFANISQSKPSAPFVVKMPEQKPDSGDRRKTPAQNCHRQIRKDSDVIIVRVMARGRGK
jgi:hypothetical protein